MATSLPPGGARDIKGKNLFLQTIIVMHSAMKTADMPIPIIMPVWKIKEKIKLSNLRLQTSLQ